MVLMKNGQRLAWEMAIKATAVYLSFLLVAVLLSGCPPPPTIYTPDYAKMNREEARQVVLGTFSRANTWTNLQGVIRVNEIKINNEGMALLYQAGKYEEGLRTYSWPTPPVVSTCYFSGINPTVKKYSTEDDWRVQFCDFTVWFDDANDANRFADALYSLKSR